MRRPMRIAMMARCCIGTWTMSLSRSSCPMTIVRAEFSDVISDERWEGIKQKVTNADFVNLDGARHLVPFEEPVRMANEIKRILGANLPSSH